MKMNVTHLVVVFSVDSRHLPAEYEIPVRTAITLSINWIEVDIH